VVIVDQNGHKTYLNKQADPRMMKQIDPVIYFLQCFDEEMFKEILSDDLPSEDYSKNC
jgi:hypothetical protein